MSDVTPREVRVRELVGDRSEEAIAALVDEHYGAMSRFSRLVGRGQLSKQPRSSVTRRGA